MKYFVLFLLVSTTGFSATGSEIVVEGADPGCYQLPNQSIHAALIKAEENARTLCEYPVLKGVDIEIKSTGGCTPVIVKASYECLR